MKTTLYLGLASLLALIPGLSLAAPASQAVKLTHMAVRVDIIPEARANVSYDYTPGKAKLPALTQTLEGDTVVLNGGLPESRSWHFDNMGDVNAGRGHIHIDGYGDLKVEDLPHLTLHVPLEARIAADGFEYGRIGPSQSLKLDANGRYGFTIDPVAKDAEIASSGAGDLHLATTGHLKLDQSGAANITFGDTHGLEVDLSGVGELRGLKSWGPVRVGLSGTGNFKLNDIKGDLDIEVSGVGNAHILAGRAPHVRMSVSGMGKAQFDGTAGDVDASMSGMGSVRIAHATGQIEKSQSGMGSITIGN